MVVTPEAVGAWLDQSSWRLFKSFLRNPSLLYIYYLCYDDKNIWNESEKVDLQWIIAEL